MTLSEDRTASGAHFEQPINESRLKTIYGVGRAAYTLLNVPAHDSGPFHEVAHNLAGEAQPTHESVKVEIESILNGPANLIDHEKRPKLPIVQALGNFGLLMQFSQYLPQLSAYGQTPYEHIDELRKEIVTRGSDKPLGYADQLTIALEQTDGDLPESLWRLLVTSRLYGRWFDSGMIDGLPSLTKAEIVQHMEEFTRSVAACKPYSPDMAQDVAGDTYYTWTHALGGVLWNSLVDKQSIGTKVGSLAVHRGTSLMHTIAHRIKAQTIVSDHTIAAEYGNVIGDVLVEILNGDGVKSQSLR